MTLIPPGTNTTYDAVRDWALRSAGFANAEGSPLDETVIDTLLLNALQQVYAQVWKNRRYESKWTFTIFAGSEQVQSAPNVFPVRTLSQIFSPMWKVIDRVVRDRDGMMVYEGEDYPKLGVATAELDPMRLCWFTWGEEFALSPPSTENETYTVFGYRQLNRTIYTVGIGDVITWQFVDLPDEVVEIYQKIVLGFLLSALGDVAQSRYWLQLASDELNSLLSQNNGQHQSKVGEGEPLVMGGRRPSPQGGNVLIFSLPVG